MRKRRPRPPGQMRPLSLRPTAPSGKPHILPHLKSAAMTPLNRLLARKRRAKRPLPQLMSTSTSPKAGPRCSMAVANSVSTPGKPACTRCGGERGGNGKETRGYAGSDACCKDSTDARTRPGEALPPSPFVGEADKWIAEKRDAAPFSLLVCLLLDAAADGQVDKRAGRRKGAGAACAGACAARPPFNLLHPNRRGQADRAGEVKGNGPLIAGVSGVGGGGAGGVGGRARRRAGAAGAADRVPWLQMAGSVRWDVESDHPSLWQRVRTTTAPSQP